MPQRVGGAHTFQAASPDGQNLPFIVLLKVP